MICPKCQQDTWNSFITLTSLPPQNVYRCTNCNLNATQGETGFRIFLPKLGPYGTWVDLEEYLSYMEN